MKLPYLSKCDFNELEKEFPIICEQLNKIINIAIQTFSFGHIQDSDFHTKMNFLLSCYVIDLNNIKSSLLTVLEETYKFKYPHRELYLRQRYIINNYN